jgi:hypothetical protein
MRQLAFVHCNLMFLEPIGTIDDDDLDFLGSAMVEAVTCDESGSATRASTQKDSCTWPWTAITTNTMASEKVPTIAAATTSTQGADV